MNNRTEDELKNSIYIKDYITKFIEDESEENAFMLYGQIMLRIAEGGKAPMPLMNVTRIAFDIDPDADAGDMFPDIPECELYMKIKGKNGRFWLPLFTERREMYEMAETNEVKEVSIKELFELAHSLPGLNGILINPYTDGFTLVQEQIEIMLKTAPEWKKAMDENDCP